VFGAFEFSSLGENVLPVVAMPLSSIDLFPYRINMQQSRFDYQCSKSGVLF
jgi:hypothetical protein